MGLFRGKKKDLSDAGVPGTAVIQSEENLDSGGDDPIRLADLGMGSFKFRLDLEVTVEGRAPYQVSGKFKVPAKLGSEAGPGVELPVFVDPDDPQRVEVDWDRFAAEGGKQKFADAYQRKREAKTREVVEAAGGDMSQPYSDTPPVNASPREFLEWQRANNIIDQATYDAIIANNPDMQD